MGYFTFDSTSPLNARAGSLMIRVNLTCGLSASRFSKSSWAGRHSRTRMANSSTRTKISKSIGREQYVFFFSFQHISSNIYNLVLFPASRQVGRQVGVLERHGEAASADDCTQCGSALHGYAGDR